MFREFNEQLVAIKEKKRRRDKLAADLKNIEDDLQKQKTRLQDLEDTLRKEGRDVQRLEGLSLVGLFHAVLGSKELQLEKERQEYLAAKLKYDECEGEIASLTGQHGRIKQELEQLKDVERQYELLLAQKEKMILAQSDHNSRRLLALSEEIADVQSEAREVQEAIDAGEAVLAEADSAIDYLSSARGWGTWDMLGGGFIATAIKHSKMDGANESVQRIQQLLCSFHRELSDLEPEVRNGIKLEIGSFLTFADYFFDGLIVDWVVQSKIVNSLEQVEKLRREVSAIVAGLRAGLKQTKASLAGKERERKELLENI